LRIEQTLFRRLNFVENPRPIRRMLAGAVAADLYRSPLGGLLDSLGAVLPRR